MDSDEASEKLIAACALFQHVGRKDAEGRATRNQLENAESAVDEAVDAWAESVVRAAAAGENVADDMEHAVDAAMHLVGVGSRTVGEPSAEWKCARALASRRIVRAITDTLSSVLGVEPPSPRQPQRKRAAAAAAPAE